MVPSVFEPRCSDERIGVRQRDLLVQRRFVVVDCQEEVFGVCRTARLGQRHGCAIANLSRRQVRRRTRTAGLQARRLLIRRMRPQVLYATGW